MKLLVVEDDRLLNNTLCYNLSAAGYTVDAAMTKSAVAIAACLLLDAGQQRRNLFAEYADRKWFCHIASCV